MIKVIKLIKETIELLKEQGVELDVDDNADFLKELDKMNNDPNYILQFTSEKRLLANYDKLIDSDILFFSR